MVAKPRSSHCSRTDWPGATRLIVAVLQLLTPHQAGQSSSGEGTTHCCLLGMRLALVQKHHSSHLMVSQLEVHAYRRQAACRAAATLTPVPGYRGCDGL